MPKKGYRQTEDHRKKLSGKIPWNKGKKYIQIMGDNNPAKRPEVRQKISEFHSGKPKSEEIKRKIRKAKEYISEEIKRKMSLNHADVSKDKNPNWRGGISKTPYCNKWTEELREEMRKRDEYQCQNSNCLCTQLESLILYDKILSVHHIHYDKENCYPDLITLCCSCNSKVNYNRDYWEEYLMNKLKERNLLNYFGNTK